LTEPVTFVTGVVLAMHYIPHVDYAFDSVEHIMRVNCSDVTTRWHDRGRF
jgi:ubiquinol-cytochrome c reductase cytochrome b subunit